MRKKPRSINQFTIYWNIFSFHYRWDEFWNGFRMFESLHHRVLFVVASIAFSSPHTLWWIKFADECYCMTNKMVWILHGALLMHIACTVNTAYSHYPISDLPQTPIKRNALKKVNGATDTAAISRCMSTLSSLFNCSWNSCDCGMGMVWIFRAFAVQTHTENIPRFFIAYPFVFADCNGIYSNIVSYSF